LAIDQRIASKGSLRTDAARRMRDLSINGKIRVSRNKTSWMHRLTYIKAVGVFSNSDI